MLCLINGESLESESLACQERQFGQPPTSLSLFDYEIQFDGPEFCTRCGPTYRKFVQDEREDEPYYRPGKNLIIDRWHRLGYPALDELLVKDPEVIEYLLSRRFGHPFLCVLFPVVKGKTRFVLNSLDKVRVRADAVLMSGRAWEA